MKDNEINFKGTCFKAICYHQFRKSSMMRVRSIITTLFLSIQSILAQTNNSIINFNELTVYQYIDLLKIDKNESVKSNILTIGVQTPKDWVTDKDIDSLVRFIESTEPSKCVMQGISSHIPSGDSSTIGGQVIDIIEAFKEKKSYPTFLTSCAKTDKKRIEEIKYWWYERNK